MFTTLWPAPTSLLRIQVTLWIFGFKSFSTDNILPAIGGSNETKPVRLLLGLARPSLKPDPKGFDALMKTIGICSVRFANDSVRTVPTETNTSGVRFTNSVALVDLSCTLD